MRRALLIRESRGATIIEFALILPTLMVLLCATLELGYRAYLTSLVQGTLTKASRLASVGGMTGAQIDAIVTDDIGKLTAAGNVKSITKQSFYNFSNVGKPEKITKDTAPMGSFNNGDCFEDTNGNGAYDTMPSQGLGTADDIIRYTVTVTYPTILPVANLIGWGSTQTIVATDVLRNQPFTSRPAPANVCT